MEAKPTLYYVHDPMCSWCWAFLPVWQAVKKQLPESIQVHNILGGLAPDSDQPMLDEMQDFLIGTWRRIANEVPSTSFNFDFWKNCKPKRSTYPACRAVIAAKQQGLEFEEKMIAAIQMAYYQQARNPSDIETLCELAKEIGLNMRQFIATLNAEETQTKLSKQMQFARQIGGNSFPSLFLQSGESYKALNLSYTDVDALLGKILE